MTTDSDTHIALQVNSHLLGDLLVDMGVISRDQLSEALTVQEEILYDTRVPVDLDRTELVSMNRESYREVPMLGQILIRKGYVSGDQLLPALEIQKRQAQALGRLDSGKLAVALQIGLAINATVNLVDVLDLIMKYANIVTDAMASTLMLLDEKTGELVFSVPTGPNADDLKDVRIPPGVGVAGWVARHKTHLLVPDTRTDDRFYAQIDSLTGMATRSLLCVPMTSKRKLIGVLEVINKKDNTSFTQEDVLLLNVFSHQAAIAIENAMLFKSMENRLEREQRIEQQMAESERLRSIGTLAGGIAHDFNNILGVIIGHTELAQKKETSPARRDANLNRVLEACDRARDLINQILTFSRQAKIDCRPIQVSAIVNDALRLIRPSLPKQVALSVEIVCDGWIMGDVTQVHQVVMNLCTNAGHAMAENDTGNLVIRLDRVDPEPDTGEICAGNRITPASGSYVRLRVADTGRGMPSHVVERMFEPFFTTKPQGEGTGMGLSVVHGIVKGYGGEIQVTSTPGKGTVFDIYFPRIVQGER